MNIRNLLGFSHWQDFPWISRMRVAFQVLFLEILCTDFAATFSIGCLGGSYNDDFFDSTVFPDYKSELSTPFSPEYASSEVVGK
jgi:hypothetical protein